jgi:F-type H+-transporting ATPase subunit b
MASTNTEVGIDDHSADVFPPFQTETYPSQLLWLALTFGLFYYLMAKVALPRISSILEVRSDRIEQDIEEANRLQRESDEAQAAYEYDLAEARNNAQVIAQRARDEAKAEADTKRGAEEARLNEMLEKADADIAATKAAAMEDVGAIAEETTQALVNSLLDGKITKAQVSKAVSKAGAGA